MAALASFVLARTTINPGWIVPGGLLLGGLLA
jgi:hypothetical protein